MAHKHDCVCCESTDDIIIIQASAEHKMDSVTVMICARCLADDINAKVVALAILERLIKAKTKLSRAVVSVTQ